MPGPGQLKGMEVRLFDRSVDALKLSRASGIPIEKFAGGMIDAEQPKENNTTLVSAAAKRGLIATEQSGPRISVASSADL
jgi:hypothetical protein